MHTNILKLIEGGELSRSEYATLFRDIFQTEMTDLEITALLISLKHRPLEANVLCGATDALIEMAKPFKGEEFRIRLDTCGTGGDGFQSLNISTLAALTCAAAGIPVVKHGNRAVSSHCGSADLLEALGIPIQNDALNAEKALENSHFCFLFAPYFHPAFKRVMPLRKALKTRTIFNVLGPLLNPARPTHQLLGVYDPLLLYPMARALKELGLQRALLVHGAGMDELNIAGPSQIVELNQGELKEYSLSPQDFGLKPQAVSALKTESRAESLQRAQNLIQGQPSGADLAAVSMNAGASLYLTGFASSLKEGTEEARKLILSGALQKVIRAHQAQTVGELAA